MPVYIIVEESGKTTRENLDFDGCPRCGRDKGETRPEAREIRVYRRPVPPYPTPFEVDCRSCGYLGDLEGNPTFPNT